MTDRCVSCGHHAHAARCWQIVGGVRRPIQCPCRKRTDPPSGSSKGSSRAELVAATATHPVVAAFGEPLGTPVPTPSRRTGAQGCAPTPFMPLASARGGSQRRREGLGRLAAVRLQWEDVRLLDTDSATGSGSPVFLVPPCVVQAAQESPPSGGDALRGSCHQVLRSPAWGWAKEKGPAFAGP